MLDPTTLPRRRVDSNKPVVCVGEEGGVELQAFGCGHEGMTDAPIRGRSVENCNKLKVGRDFYDDRILHQSCTG